LRDAVDGCGVSRDSSVLLKSGSDSESSCVLSWFGGSGSASEALSSFRKNSSSCETMSDEEEPSEMGDRGAETDEVKTLESWE
jgi:hypothetical protein